MEKEGREGVVICVVHLFVTVVAVLVAVDRNAFSSRFFTK